MTHLLLAVLVAAQTGDSTNSADQQFATQAMHQLLQGVSNADAAQSGGDAQLKSIATTIQTDQIGIGNQLVSLASYYGINVSTDPVKASTDASGYAAAETESLKTLIVLFENEKQNGGGAELRSFAVQELPTLQKDLAALQN